MKPVILIAVAAALCCATPAFAQTFPSFASQRTSYDVRFVPSSSAGGVVDNFRASAVAGVPAHRVDLQSVRFLEDELDDRGLRWREIDAAFVDVNGVYWLFYDRQDRRRIMPDDLPTDVCSSIG